MVRWRNPVVLTVVLGLCAFLLPVTTPVNLAFWLTPFAVVGSYLAGRHLPRLSPGLIALALGTLFALPVLLFTGLSVQTMVFTSLATLVIFVILPWWAGRLRHNAAAFRAAEAEHLVVQAELRERTRIANQMHDELGHDLALLALQAGALQLAAEDHPQLSSQAENIRSRADGAIASLHEIVGVLREEGQTAPLQPRGGSLNELLTAARAGGLELEVDQRGQFPETLPQPWWSQTVHQVVREVLSNAAKYAQDSRLTVKLELDGDPVVVRASNRAATEALARPGASGLAALRQLVEGSGGTMQATHRHGRFEVLARIPRLERLSAVPARAPRRRSARIWAAVLVPVMLLGVLGGGLVYVLDATYRATALHPSDFQRLELGMSAEAVASIVTAPGLDRALPITAEPARPENSQCRYYAAHTGPFDFGNEMFRLCFSNNMLVSADQLHPAKTPEGTP